MRTPGQSPTSVIPRNQHIYLSHRAQDHSGLSCIDSKCDRIGWISDDRLVTKSRNTLIGQPADTIVWTKNESYTSSVYHGPVAAQFLSGMKYVIWLAYCRDSSPAKRCFEP